MKFNLNSDGILIETTGFAGDISAMSDGAGRINNFEHANFNVWDWFAERGKVNQYNESVKNGDHQLWSWIQSELHTLFLDMWNWFILNLPDIVGYMTMAAGAGIILSAMIGRGGMMKVLGWYAGIVILVICILGGGI